MEGRNTDGTFAVGNPGGPGRPRRAVEREYLARLSDTVSLEAWERVCARILAAAEAGEPKAWDILTRYLIGPEPPKLLTLAADEVDGFDANAEVEQERKARKDARLVRTLADYFSGQDSQSQADGCPVKKKCDCK